MTIGLRGSTAERRSVRTEEDERTCALYPPQPNSMDFGLYRLSLLGRIAVTIASHLLKESALILR